MEANPKRFVLTVLVPDRVGILRDVTGAVSELEGTVDAIRQTVVNDFFSLTLTAAFPAEVGADRLKTALRRRLGVPADEACLLVRPHVPASSSRRASGSRYVVLVQGEDRAGVLFELASFFVQRHINIEDWQVESSGDETRYIGQVTLPPRLDVRRVQQELREHAERMRLSASLCHENIFRATNELGPIKGLLTEERHDR